MLSTFVLLFHPSCYFLLLSKHTKFAPKSINFFTKRFDRKQINNESERQS